MIILLILYLLGYFACVYALFRAELFDSRALSLGMFLMITYLSLFWCFIFPMFVILWIDEKYKYDIIKQHECSKTYKGKIKRWLSD